MRSDLLLSTLPIILTGTMSIRKGSPVDKLLTIDEVAERLRKPAATLRYWRHISFGPPSAKFGRDLRYRETDVQAWIDEQFKAGADAVREGA